MREVEGSAGWRAAAGERPNATDRIPLGPMKEVTGSRPARFWALRSAERPPSTQRGQIGVVGRVRLPRVGRHASDTAGERPGAGGQGGHASDTAGERRLVPVDSAATVASARSVAGILRGP